MVESSNIKILVVEDEPKSGEILKQFLEKEGYQIEIARGGQTALSIVEKFKPQCVLLDIRLPEMDGLKVLKRIKIRHPQIEVIMTTAIANSRTGQECLKAGAYTHMIKPLNLVKLRDTIREALHVESIFSDRENPPEEKVAYNTEESLSVEPPSSPSPEEPSAALQNPEVQALVELLEEKRILTKEEVLEKVKLLKHR